MRKSLIGLSFVLLAGLAQADPAPDRADLLRSAWYADAAMEALASADRATAILTALRGLPEDPMAEDLETYADAFDALYLAAASAAFQADIPVDSSLFWSPDGRYIVTAAFTPESSQVTDQGTELWNTQTGQLVAELLPGIGAFDYTNINQFSGFANPYSPDSSMVAISISPEDYASADMAGQLNIHATATGDRLATVAGDMFHGWSQSGTTAIVTNRIGNVAWLYDTSSWQVVAQIPDGTFPGGSQYSFIPGQDDAFYAIHEDYGYDPNGAPVASRIYLYRLGRDGARQVADLTTMAGLPRLSGFLSFATNTHQPYLALRVYGGDLAILGLDGQVRSVIPDVPIGSNVEFVRDGTAILVVDPMMAVQWDESLVRVFDLDGQALAPDIREIAPITDRVMTPDGQTITFPNNRRPPAPDAWPTGLELYSQIWPQIPAELQAQINAERVSRP